MLKDNPWQFLPPNTTSWRRGVSKFSAAPGRNYFSYVNDDSLFFQMEYLQKPFSTTQILTYFRKKTNIAFQNIQETLGSTNFILRSTFTIRLS